MPKYSYSFLYGPLAPKDFIPIKFSVGIYFSHPLITPASIPKSGFLPKIIFFSLGSFLSKISKLGMDITLVLKFSSESFLEAA